MSAGNAEKFYPDITATNADALAYTLETKGVVGIDTVPLASFLRRAARTIRYLNTQAEHAELRLACLEGTAALVWKWREEADATAAALEGEVIAHVMRSCADELANSLPAQIVAQAGAVQDIAAERERLRDP